MAAKPEVLTTLLLLHIKRLSKIKLGHKASHMYTISTDSGPQHRLPTIKDGGQ